MVQSEVIRGRIRRHLGAWVIVAVGLFCLIAAQGPVGATAHVASVGAVALITPPPTPTATPIPIDGTSVTCAPSLVFGDGDVVVVGDTFDVTLAANCVCGPLETPGKACGFTIRGISEIAARGFDAPTTPIDLPAASFAIQLQAARASQWSVQIVYEGDVTIREAGAGGSEQSIPRSFTVTDPIRVIRNDEPANTSIVHARSCLAGGGRSDINIVNTGDEAALYRIEYEGLTPRELLVEAGDWWRMPVTGRDGGHWVVVRRDGVPSYGRFVTLRCSEVSPLLSPFEVEVVNACRGGNGYLLFQFVNHSSSPKPYVIEFEGVRNRSTTAAGYGQSARAVTGRPNGDFDWTIRSGATIVDEGTVTVDC